MSKSELKSRLWLLSLIIMPLMLVSCKAEFNPNDDWREIPVVYCILDQDDDTTFVRVQKCFLGEGDQRVYATVGDSINYPEGAITVRLEAWNTWIDNDGGFHRYGESPDTVFDFTYTESIDKEDGVFYSGKQPYYYCVTSGLLDTSYIYHLVIIKTATGDTIAQSETMLISGEMQLLKPNELTKFQFSGTAGSKSCEISWTKMRNARRYQPIVRFNYRDFIIDHSNTVWDTTIIRHYIDIPCSVIKSNMISQVLTTRIDQNYFLSIIKTSIGDEVVNRNIIDTVQIFVNCCTEDLSAYLFSGSHTGSIIQQSHIYTNIQGGLGVFAARRTHIFFSVPTPASSGSDYVKALKQLDIGF